MILAADIGGTKTAVAWFERAGQALVRRASQTYSSQAHAGLEPILQDFLVRHPGTVDAACFGIAGPILNNRCETTNLPWVIDAQLLMPLLGTDRVRLVNDLEATGYGIAALTPQQLLPLQAGLPRPGHGVLVAAGTGLGEAILFWNGHHHVPMPTEGGHADFAPRDAWEQRLLTRLQAQLGHVSVERVLSGPGLTTLFDQLVLDGHQPTAEVLEARRTLPDPSPALAEADLSGRCSVCATLLERFVSLYGAEVGNMALKTLAVGGVFIGGGIGPRLKSLMTSRVFLDAFLDKGRFRGLLETLPVTLILEPDTALIGAARAATLQLSI